MQISRSSKAAPIVASDAMVPAILRSLSESVLPIVADTLSRLRNRRYLSAIGGSTVALAFVGDDGATVLMGLFL